MKRRGRDEEERKGGEGRGQEGRKGKRKRTSERSPVPNLPLHH